MKPILILFLLFALVSSIVLVRNGGDFLSLARSVYPTDPGDAGEPPLLRSFGKFCQLDSDCFRDFRCIQKRCQIRINEETPTPSVTPTPTPNSTVNLFKNSSFEGEVIPSENNDRDPEFWVIKEGLASINSKGGETGDIIKEYPRMTSVVSAENGVQPRSGSKMLKNNTRLELKSQFRQNYSHQIQTGTFIQKLSLYVPNQNGFLQQMEFRTGLESFHMRWTNEFTNVCWKTVSGPKGFCKKFSPISYDRWNNIQITLTQLTANINIWKINVELNGATLIRSNGNSIPHVELYQGAIGQVFIGDEGQSKTTPPSDGFGTIYFDDIEAYN